MSPTSLRALLALIVVLGLVRGQETCSPDDGNCKEEGDIDVECEDQNADCLTWAARGECTGNAKFMSSVCRQSCELCSSTRVPDWEDADCEDLHPKCSDWSALGECISNPGYMLMGCKRSCFKCMNVKKEREEGVDEEELLKRFRFVSGDWGEIQQLGSDEEKGKVSAIVVPMMEYALRNVTTLPLEERLLCKNKHANCAYWAAKGECENNLFFMMSDCPLVCQFCDMKSKFQDCREQSEDPWVLPGDLKAKYENLKKQPNAELASGSEVQDQDDPWVLKFDNFLSSKEADELLALAKSLEWQASAPVASGSLKETGLVRRESESAFCKDCGDKAHAKLQMKIADLVQADPSLMQSLEFVHYGNSKSFGMHHDFRLHDVWMPAGPRVLSIFLCLSEVPEGGAMGFPNLDWLSIPPKKGQLLIWPNVLSSDPLKSHKDMMSEGLPVLEGEKYGVHAWVRLHNYKKAEEKGCV